MSLHPTYYHQLHLKNLTTWLGRAKSEAEINHINEKIKQTLLEIDEIIENL